MKNIHKFLLLTFFAINTTSLQSSDQITTTNYTVTNKTNIPVTFRWLDVTKNARPIINQILQPNQNITVPYTTNSQLIYTVFTDQIGSTTINTLNNGLKTIQSFNIILDPTGKFFIFQQIDKTQTSISLDNTQVATAQDVFNLASSSLLEDTTNLQSWLKELQDAPSQDIIVTSQEVISDAQNDLEILSSYQQSKLTDLINQLKSIISQINNQIDITKAALPKLQPYIDQLNNLTNQINDIPNIITSAKYAILNIPSDMTNQIKGLINNLQTAINNSSTTSSSGTVSTSAPLSQLTLANSTPKKTGSGKWKAACKHDGYCKSGKCKNGFCTKS